MQRSKLAVCAMAALVGLAMACSRQSASPASPSSTAAATANADPGVTLTVNATGTAPLSFQWTKSGVDLSGQTSSTLTLNNVTSADAGAYSVKVSNAAGATTSVTANVTVNAATTAPQIVLQPVSQTVSPVANVTLSVNATGSGSLKFQWQKNGVDIAG